MCLRLAKHTLERVLEEEATCVLSRFGRSCSRIGTRNLMQPWSLTEQMVREESASPRSPPGGTMQFSRSRHGVSISSTSLRPRLGAANPSAHHRSSMSLMLSGSSSPENRPPPSPTSNADQNGGQSDDQTDGNAKPSAKRKKVDGGFALPVGRAPISPKWVRRSLSISRKAVGRSSKSDKLDV